VDFQARARRLRRPSEYSMIYFLSNGTLLMYEGQRNLTAVLQLGDSRARAQGVLRE
jgi:hypothetical protein